MEIILVIADKKGKNILFILDNLQALSLKEAIDQAKKGNISGVHLVEASGRTYIRVNPNATQKDNLDSISIPLSALTRSNMTEKEAGAVSKYSRCRQRYLQEQEKAGEKIIYVDGKRESTEREITDYLSNYRKEIQNAARDLKVDKCLLGAILIDEYLRLDWIDSWSDWLAILGCNRSVGIAQVKIETARELIQRGFYPADPANKSISPEKADQIPNGVLYAYLNDAGHPIYFVAAKINQIKKDFAGRYDVARLDIVADLYSRKDLESTDGKVTVRGRQKATEFYQTAKKVLK